MYLYADKILFRLVLGDEMLSTLCGHAFIGDFAKSTEYLFIGLLRNCLPLISGTPIEYWATIWFLRDMCLSRMWRARERWWPANSNGRSRLRRSRLPRPLSCQCSLGVLFRAVVENKKEKRWKIKLTGFTYSHLKKKNIIQKSC